MAVSLRRRKSLSLSPSPSIGSNASSRSSHSHCEQKLHILRYELCLSCLNNRPRSKSSSSLMSKIARKLGRISVKPDQDPFEAPPPFGDERDDNTGQSGGHTLQVPTPRIQQKNLKSISTSHLERTYDGCVYVTTRLHVYVYEWTKMVNQLCTWNGMWF